jgi:hypothetical protein
VLFATRIDAGCLCSEDKDNWLIITGVPVSVTNDTLRRQLDLRDDSLFLERIKRLVEYVLVSTIDSPEV